MVSPSYTYEAAMHRVIDGDTYELEIDLGFSIHAVITVRLHGYNVDERGTTAGDSATEFCKHYLPPNMPLKVKTYKGPRSGADRMTFARWVADVYVPTGEHFGEVLRNAGYAKVRS